jgi:hypothetical protein
VIDISYYYIFIVLTFLIGLSFILDYYLWKRIQRLDSKYDKLSGKSDQTRNYVSELYAYIQQYRK